MGGVSEDAGKTPLRVTSGNRLRLPVCRANSQLSLSVYSNSRVWVQIGKRHAESWNFKSGKDPLSKRAKKEGPWQDANHSGCG